MRVANNLESCMNAANDVALYQSIATGIFAVAAGIFSGGVGAAFIGTVGAAETAHTFNENVNRCTRDNTQGNLECERR
ncbi:hypothetical protein [Glaciecola sp. 1036]|uniref:hypothetical protein n=1 Tax=Alteromonadaceae TaxID=72275 RepID=UPI003D072FAF